MTTIAAWLDARRPVPPPLLAERVRTLLGEALHRDAADAADVCLAAGERALAALLRADAASRETALDLLAADALVTYAFEAAASQPERLEARASRAMARVSALGAGAGA